MNLRLTMTLACATSMAVIAQQTVPTQNTAPTGKPRQEIEVAAPQSPRTNGINTNALSNLNQPKTNIAYSGLGPEFRKSTNRWRTFSLRRPANLKEDESNLTREGLRTEASPAVKLISIDF